jgi:hypothetical protein
MWWPSSTGWRRPSQKTNWKVSIVDLLEAADLDSRWAQARHLPSKGGLSPHEDPAGLFADVKFDGTFTRCPVNTPAERSALLDKLQQARVSTRGSERQKAQRPPEGGR